MSLEFCEAINNILIPPLVNAIKNSEHFLYHPEIKVCGITSKCSSQKQILGVELGQQNNVSMVFEFYLIQK